MSYKYCLLSSSMIDGCFYFVSTRHQKQIWIWILVVGTFQGSFQENLLHIYKHWKKWSSFASSGISTKNFPSLTKFGVHNNVSSPSFHFSWSQLSGKPFFVSFLFTVSSNGSLLLIAADSTTQHYHAHHHLIITIIIVRNNIDSNRAIFSLCSAAKKSSSFSSTSVSISKSQASATASYNSERRPL